MKKAINAVKWITIGLLYFGLGFGMVLAVANSSGVCL